MDPHPNPKGTSRNIFYCIMNDKLQDYVKYCNVQELISKDNTIVHTRNAVLDAYPLHTAVEYNQLSIAALILDSGADINAVDTHNETALHLAVKKGLSEMVFFLLFHNANIIIQNKDGETALHLAIKATQSFTETVIREVTATDKTRFIISKSEYSHISSHTIQEKVTDKGVTAKVADYNNIKNVKILLLYCSSKNRNIKDNLRRRPQDLIENHPNNCFQLLLKENFASNIDLNYHKRSGLHWAAVFDLPIFAIYLLKKPGTDINAQDAQGCTPLHLAAMHASPKILLVLCYNQKTLINAIDVTGDTAFQKSVNPMVLMAGLHPTIHDMELNNRVNCIKIFINASPPVDRNHKNKAGKTADNIIRDIKDPAARNSIFDAFISIPKSRLNTRLEVFGNCAAPKTLRLPEQDSPHTISRSSSKKGSKLQYHEVSAAELMVKKAMLAKIKFMKVIEELQNNLHEGMVSSGLESSYSTSDISPRDSGHSSTSPRKISPKKNTKKSDDSEKQLLEIIQLLCVVKIDQQPFTVDSQEIKKATIHLLERYQPQDIMGSLTKLYNEFTDEYQKTNSHCIIENLILLQADFPYRISDAVCTKAYENYLKVCPGTIAQSLSSQVRSMNLEMERVEILSTLCTGRIEQGKVKVDPEDIRLATIGLLDFYKPQEILNSLRLLSDNAFSNNYQHINGYLIVKNVILLQTEFGYKVSDVTFKNAFFDYLKICPLTISQTLSSILDCTIELEKSHDYNAFIRYRSNALNRLPENPEKIIVKINKALRKTLPLEDTAIDVALQLGNIAAVVYQNNHLHEYQDHDIEALDNNISNIKKLIIISEGLRALIQAIILSQKSLQLRVKAYSFWVKVANECLKYPAGPVLHFLTVITATLNNIIFNRLTRTLKGLDPTIIKLMEFHRSLINTYDNHSHLRKYIAENPIHLPFTGFFLQEKILAPPAKIQRAVYLGQLYQPLLVFKENMEFVLFENNSDLYQHLLQAMPITEDQLDKMSFWAEPDVCRLPSCTLSAFNKNLLAFKKYSHPLILYYEKKYYSNGDCMKILEIWLVSLVKKKAMTTAEKDKLLLECLEHIKNTDADIRKDDNFLKFFTSINSSVSTKDPTPDKLEKEASSFNS